MNLNDSGPDSLRQAISDTPAGGTVDFQPGLTGTIALNSGFLAINKDLTIAGPGAEVITVSGHNALRVFYIAAGFTVQMSGLTIADAHVTNGDGGGVYNSGTLTLNNCTVSGNVALAGGGLVNGGALTLNNCTVSGNSAQANTQFTRDGGGIYNLSGGSVTVTGSTLSGNFGLQGRRGHRFRRRHSDRHRLHPQRQLRLRKRRGHRFRLRHSDRHRLRP
jgi:hypothetical protein